jgi:hypothetical protein
MSKVCFNSNKATYEKAIKVQIKAYQNKVYNHRKQTIKKKKNSIYLVNRTLNISLTYNFNTWSHKNKPFNLVRTYLDDLYYLIFFYLKHDEDLKQVKITLDALLQSNKINTF